MSSWAFFTLSDNNAGTGSARAATLTAQLRGSGTIALTQCGSTNSVLTVSCNTSTFSGRWVVASGTLLGAVTGSLGTNDITVNPYAPLALNTLNAGAPVFPPPFPAVVEFAYDVNSAGTLTLTNGGQLRLHQNCCFTVIKIEGVSLSPGTHPYSELLAKYPRNVLSGGSGGITVQPFGAPPALAPTITTQPLSQTRYAGGMAIFSAVASGQGTLSYAWRKNGASLADGGNLSGSVTPSLTIANLSAPDAAAYDVVVTNAVGSVTSLVATLTVMPTNNPGNPTPVIPVGLDAFRQWDRWPYQRIGARAYMRSRNLVRHPGRRLDLGADFLRQLLQHGL